MLNAATTQAVAVAEGIPDAFRRVWSTRGSPLEPSAQDWAAYDAEAPNFNMHVAMARPGFLHGTDPSETIDDLRNYRAHWLVARTAEHHRRLVDAAASVARYVLCRYRSRHGSTENSSKTRCWASKRIWTKSGHD